MATAELLIAKGADVESKNWVRHGNMGMVIAGVETACTVAESGNRLTNSHRDKRSD